ncbi:MAG: protoheme IX farnesyltransferase [Ignavibacteriales bacterium]|nr:protoheme IX farnesyltransferase [Ignavibacteriales bacterium]
MISYIQIRSYIDLIKPELTGLSTLTSVCAFYLASTDGVDTTRLSSAAFGTLLVGGGAGALNEYFERKYDALMKRTERRPLPAGRISPLAALIFGNSIAIAGLVVLAAFNNLLTAFFAALTLVTYLVLYTPLKRVVWWNTLVGAIPGSLPTFVGWAAARNGITVDAWVLFGILFVWQIPHFLSLAWMYKKDYARAGFRMLPVIDEWGRRTSLHILVASSLLLAVSLCVSWIGLAGRLYLVTALLLSFGLLWYAILFRLSTLNQHHQALANRYSRRIFFSSLLYLPTLMLVMVVDKV